MEDFLMQRHNQRCSDILSLMEFGTPDSNFEFRGYIPSLDKRFYVSRDPISQERYKFSEEIGETLKELPFYKGLTLKGSLSKGKLLTHENASQSDINLGCFLDFSSITQLSKMQLVSLCLKHGIRFQIDKQPVTINEGKYNIFQTEELSSENLAKIRLVRQIVDQRIQKQGKRFFKDSQEKQPYIWPEVAIYSSDGPFSIYSTFEVYEKSQDKSDEERVAVTRALTLPFGMIVEGDLKPYLRAFFEKLQSLGPEISEQKWQVVRKAIIENERPGSIPPAIEDQFPKTIDEALKMYV